MHCFTSDSRSRIVFVLTCRWLLLALSITVFYLLFLIAAFSLSAISCRAERFHSRSHATCVSGHVLLALRLSSFPCVVGFDECSDQNSKNICGSVTVIRVIWGHSEGNLESLRGCFDRVFKCQKSKFKGSKGDPGSLFFILICADWPRLFPISVDDTEA